MGRSSSSGSSSSSRSFSSGSSSRTSSGGWSSSGRSHSSGSRSSSSSSNSFNSGTNTYSSVSRTVSRTVSRGINNSIPNRRTYSRGNVSYGGYSSQSLNSNTSLFIILAISVVVTILLSGAFSSSISKSTIERTPITQAQEVEYIYDDLDWISNQSRAESGMKEFYKKTGVQPVILIKDNINGDTHPNNNTVNLYLEETYDSLFKDESHMLLLIMDTGNDWGSWTYVGSTASTVVDSEAQEIILQYTDKWYNSDPESVTEDEMISNIFSESAKRIMTVTKSPLNAIIIIVVFGSVVAGISLIVLKQLKVKAKLAEENRRILESDLKGSDDI